MSLSITEKSINIMIIALTPRMSAYFTMADTHEGHVSTKFVRPRNWTKSLKLVDSKISYFLGGFRTHLTGIATVVNSNLHW